MARIFVIADPHFGHQNIIAYENRPYSSVEEMDFAMIYNWNHVGEKQDFVYVSGVVLFLGKGKIKQIIYRL